MTTITVTAKGRVTARATVRPSMPMVPDVAGGMTPEE